MQNGMIPTQPTPHNRPYFVPTSKLLIPPSASGKMRRRLVGRQVCQLGGGGFVIRGGCHRRACLRRRFVILDAGDEHCLPVVTAMLNPELQLAYDAIRLQYVIAESHWYVSAYKMQFTHPLTEQSEPLFRDREGDQVCRGAWDEGAWGEQEEGGGGWPVAGHGGGGGHSLMMRSKGRGSQKRLGGCLEPAAKAAEGGYCRLDMSRELPVAVGKRASGPSTGGPGPPPPPRPSSNASPPSPSG